MHKLQSTLIDFNSQLERLVQTYKQIDKTSLQAIDIQSRFDSARTSRDGFIRNFIDQHPTSFSSLIAINLLDPKSFTSDYIKVDSTLQNVFPNSPLYRDFHLMVGQLSKLNSGSVAPDIKLPDPHGNMISLEDFRGKYVLIDFWASWCRPCRDENPNVVKIYNKYHGKGFEILGVSLDQSKDAWVRAIKSDGLTWPQISDLKYWNSSVVRLYNISGIPHTVLVDPKGKIMATGLRGQSLEQTLAQLFD